jgi:hypothetical protein
MHSNRPLWAIALGGALMGTLLVPVEASEPAETLYQTHCLQCHGSEIYTRADRKVTSLEGLERQVQRCELSLGLQWFDEDIGEVASYLNQHYYHFPR